MRKNPDFQYSPFERVPSAGTTSASDDVERASVAMSATSDPGDSRSTAMPPIIR